MNKNEKELEIEVLICTFDGGIDSVIETMLPRLTSVLVTISHQFTCPSFESNHDWPDTVQYLTLEGVGLAKNRNNALKNARGDICVIADDDIEYVDNFRDIVRNAYCENEIAVSITFQSVGAVRWSNQFTHNWRTIVQVASWMITFRKSWVLQNNILFDERFGLGAQYPQGEENIFLADVRRKGGVVISHSDVLVEHSDVSSGYYFTPDRITGKIAAIRRMYGRYIAAVVLCVFLVTKYKYYSMVGISMLGFLRSGIRALSGPL